MFFLAFSGEGSPVKAEVYSPVYGFLKFDCPSGSDTVVSVPFHPSPRWAGRLLSAPTAQGGGTRLSLKDTPAFAAGELTDTPHLLLCRDAAGPQGRHFRILAHGASTLDIEATPTELGGLSLDGLVSVVPAWTLDSLFPPSTQTTFHRSSGPLASGRGSELLFFDANTAGTHLAPSRRFYVTGTAWHEVGSFTEAGDVSLVPGQAFLIRHREGAALTTFVAHQQVYGDVVSLSLPVSIDGARDTMVAPPRPVSLTLAELDLGPAQFEESTSTDEAHRRDQLLVFDNEAVGMNKTAAATYFRFGGSWREATTGFPLRDSQVIEPSAGILLRKAAGSSGMVIPWVNAPTYDVTAP